MFYPLRGVKFCSSLGPKKKYVFSIAIVAMLRFARKYIVLYCVGT